MTFYKGYQPIATTNTSSDDEVARGTSQSLPRFVAIYIAKLDCGEAAQHVLWLLYGNKSTCCAAGS